MRLTRPEHRILAATTLGRNDEANRTLARPVGVVQRRLRFDPADPIWPNRDRFVLSAGHASMLLYSMLHLTGVKAVSERYETLGEPSVPLDAIRNFRQLDSRCPGHPEYRWTSGVETTTGPLGQGGPTGGGEPA